MLDDMSEGQRFHPFSITSFFNLTNQLLICTMPMVLLDDSREFRRPTDFCSRNRWQWLHGG